MPKDSTFICQWPSQPNETKTLKQLQEEYDASKVIFDNLKETIQHDSNNHFLQELLDQLGNQLQIKRLTIDLILYQIEGSL